MQHTDDAPSRTVGGEGRVPDSDWGCLHVWCDTGDAFARVRRAVVSAHERQGISLVPWKDPHALPVPMAPIPALTPMASGARCTLDEDEVLVLVEPTDGWIAVMSRRWEWAPPLRHPLAETLSVDFDVLSITSVAERYAEITRYRGGHAIEASIVGPSAPTMAAHVAALDLTWFEHRGAAIPAHELRDYLWDPERFGALAGPDMQGHRDAFAAAPLADYPREGYLIFRRS